MRVWWLPALLLASRLGAQPLVQSLTSAEIASAERITLRVYGGDEVFFSDMGWGSASVMKVFVIHRDGRVERSMWIAAEFDYLITGDTLQASRSSMDSLFAKLIFSEFSAVWRATTDTLHLMWTNAGRTVSTPLVHPNGIHEGIATLTVEGQGVVSSASVIANRVRCRD